MSGITPRRENRIASHHRDGARTRAGVLRLAGHPITNDPAGRTSTFTTIAQRLLRRLPPLYGQPIRIEQSAGLRDRHSAVHAGSFLRERRIAFDCTEAEFPRIFVHELFHFVWLRLGNPIRRDWEALLQSERKANAAGDLGWSAEWRKQALAPGDIRRRTRRWREYCCESFCDTAAWLYSGTPRHAEFTLPGRFRASRRAWFGTVLEGRQLSV